MNKYLKADAWCIVEEGFDPDNMRSSESIFSIGNGRFGQRANFEEGYSGDHMLGSYVGGVYYPDRTKVGWWKNGYPEYFAKVLNATNWTRTDIVVNGQALDLNVAKSIEGFKRILDMRRGLLKRTCTVEQDGAKIKLETNHQHGFAESCGCEIRVTPVHGVTTLEFQPTLDGACRTRTPIGTIHSGATRGTNRCWGRHFGALEHRGNAFTVACAQAVLEATWTDRRCEGHGLGASFASIGAAGAAQARGIGRFVARAAFGMSSEGAEQACDGREPGTSKSAPDTRRRGRTFGR